jgi:hypothetical protein
MPIISRGPTAIPGIFKIGNPPYGQVSLLWHRDGVHSFLLSFGLKKRDTSSREPTVANIALFTTPLPLCAQIFFAQTFLH